MDKHANEKLLKNWSMLPPWPVWKCIKRHFSSIPKPPPAKVMDMALGFTNSMMLYVAQKLDIPEILAEGPMTPSEVAKKIAQNCDADAIDRLMHALSACGLLKMLPPGTDGSPRFINTEMSALLRESHPNCLKGLVGHLIEEGYPAMHKLECMFRSKPQVPWDVAFPEYANTPEWAGLWKYFEARPEQEKQFTRAMTGADSLGAVAMVADFPWSSFKRVVDIAGSDGKFLHHVLEENSTLSAVLFDRPPVIQLAEKEWTQSGRFASACGRGELVAGDFFDVETVPKAKDGDVFMMRFVIHDWTSPNVMKILRSMRNAIGQANASLIIGETAMPERHQMSPIPTVYTFDMMMMVFFGDARERTPTQWHEALGAAGFRIKKIHPTRGLLQWVEAVPK
jgi:hypothetical protein